MNNAMLKAMVRKDAAIIRQQRKDIVLSVLFAVFMLVCPILAADSITQTYGAGALFGFKALYPSVAGLIPCLEFTIDIMLDEYHDSTRDFLFSQNFSKGSLLFAQNIVPNLAGMICLFPSLILLKLFILPELTFIQLLIIWYCGVFVSIFGCNMAILFSNYITRQDYLVTSSLMLSGGVYTLMSFFLYPLGPKLLIYLGVSVVFLFCSVIANLIKYKHNESYVRFERL